MSGLHTTNDFWWMTPLQAFTVIGTATNFGASALQTPLTMPMLEISSLPTHHAAQQTAWLLHHSEYFFPPLNAACTLSSLIMTVTAYLHKDSSRVAAEKFPYLAAATGLGFATTAYALTIMVPVNNGLKAFAKKLAVDATDKSAESGFRSLLQRWKLLNLGRASLMISGAIVSAYGLLLDGSVVRL